MKKNKVDTSDVHRIGVDLAKNVIQVYAVDGDGRKLLNQRFTAAKALGLFESLESCEIGIEACGGAHQWGPTLTEMPAQYVKPFVKTNKNDAADA